MSCYGGFMKRILDKKLLREYIDKHNIEEVFHEDLIKIMELHFYEKDESIFIAESNLEYYYLLVEGRVRISYLFENGKAMILKVYSINFVFRPNPLTFYDCLSYHRTFFCLYLF